MSWGGQDKSPVSTISTEQYFACIWVLPWKGVEVEEFIPASALDCRITSNCDFWHPTEHPINDLKTVQEVFPPLWPCVVMLLLSSSAVCNTLGNIPTAKRSCQLIKAQMGTTKFGYDYTHAWPYGMHNDELQATCTVSSAAAQYPPPLCCPLFLSPLFWDWNGRVMGVLSEKSC